MFDTTESAVPPALSQLLELFTTRLADVRFPDLDARVLGTAAEQVRERAEAVARAQAALEAARAALQEGQDALLARGQRALAYARVFAEDDAELTAQLDAISLPRAARRASKTDAVATAPEAAPAGDDAAAPARRRGRPPKAKPSAPSLFAEQDGAAATATMPDAGPEAPVATAA